MDKIKRSTFGKICLAVVFSLIFTTAAFSGGLAVVFGSAGMYNTSLEDFREAVLLGEIWDASQGMQDRISINKKGKIKVRDVKDESYDYTVKYKGKTVYSTYDKKTAYAGSAESNVWIYDEQKGKEVCPQVTAYLKAENNPVTDKWNPEIEMLYSHSIALIVIAIAGMLISVLLFVLMMMWAGLREEDDDVHLRGIDKVPADLYLVLAACIDIALVATGAAVTKSDILTGIFTSYMLGIICMLIFSAFTMSLAVQIKSRRMLRKTVCRRAVLAIMRGIKSLPVVWKAVAGAFIIAIMNFMIFAMFSMSGFSILLWLFVSGTAFIAGVWYLSAEFSKLKKGGENVAAGNTEYRIDTKGMLPSMKEHAENINSINEAVKKAVDEQMKSERFKTELITNVSHDIKTPLTSVINYTELLKAEEIENETAREYIDTIAKHAARLKKLAVDVVDASKAGTGNVKIEPIRLSIGTMAEQVFGEYREKIEAKGLKPVIDIPEEDIIVMADGNQMGRVIDNVLSNICKYAQEGTRVYMEVFRDGDRACIVFKNISSQELNITPDELMERFVRGDESRNSEGSGLGLNIANSLMRLQRGDFKISIDGDLFKTEISIPVA